MNSFFYNLGIYFYQFAIRVAALFSPKAAKFVKGRKKLLKRLKTEFSSNKTPVVWFHCASLGEFEQGRPLIEVFKKEYSNIKILLTFFSPSGYEVRKNYNKADWVFYLPMDTPGNAKDFINIVNPRIAIFIKYEYWYNLLKETNRRHIPLISVSSIFRKDQVFFKPYGGFFKKILCLFDHHFVQDNHSLGLLKSAGIKNASESGDTRFDRVKAVQTSVKSIPIAEKFTKGQEVLIAGSCWPEDMEVLTPFINERKDLKFIIAPHDLNEKFLYKLEQDILRETIRFSQADIENLYDYDVLIIDNIGMLSNLYQYGKYAYIGGAFGQGLHNILEPCTFGMPIFFGNKKYQKFKEANDLINLGAAFAVPNFSIFRKQFDQVSEVVTYQVISEVTHAYISGNTGATDIIMDYCCKNIDA